MGRVSTNTVGLAYAAETSLGEAGTDWAQLEPNDISAFGATITKVARNPISTRRDRRKGVVTDLDSSVEFESDLTISAFTDFAEAFCFATAKNVEADFSPTAAETTGDSYTVPSMSAATAALINFSTDEFATLVYARGFSSAANNGLKQVDTDASATDTAVAVVENLVDETPTGNAEVQLAGVRLLDAATDIVVAYSGTTLTITEQGGISGFDWSDFGIQVGQLVHVGGVTSGGAVQNALEDSTANDTYGYARVTAISTTVLTLDKVDASLQVASPTSPATLDLLFGKFIRNVAVDNSDYLERSFTVEAAYPNLGSGGATEYEYAKGNYVNTIGLSMPLTDKATMSVAMIGTDTDTPTTSRKSGASTAVEANQTAAFGTSSDIARLRLTELDEDGLSTCFKSLTLNINNNVSAEKCLGSLGASFINTGNFEIDVETQLIFENSTIISAIKNNETLTLDWSVKNDDGAVAFDIPALTLDGGDREFPENESVLINTTAQAFRDSTLGYSIGISLFPVIPTA